MEQAFNGASWGYASHYLGAEDETFDSIQERRFARDSTDDAPPHLFTIGPGWFGWPGR
jgi:hypothetical protein